MTTFSIVITTYGDEEWLETRKRAIRSVEHQGADEWIVYHEADGTIGPSRNAAAAKAKGDRLIFLDGDDELAPGYVDAMRRHPRVKDNVLLQPSVQYVKNGSRATPYLLPYRDLRHDNYLVVGTSILRTTFLEVGGFGDYPHGLEDFSLWAKAWKFGATVEPVKKAVYVAHVNPQSKHRQMWRRRNEQVYWHQRVQHEIFPEDFPKAPTPPSGRPNALFS